jgi:hypothetical protein
MQHARWSWVLAAGVVLGGCAAPGIRHGSQSDPNDDFDAGKVATVTQWAQTRGATVVWLHYPTKRRNDNDGG